MLALVQKLCKLVDVPYVLRQPYESIQDYLDITQKLTRGHYAAVRLVADAVFPSSFLNSVG